MQFSDFGPFTKPIIFFFSYQIEKRKSNGVEEIRGRDWLKRAKGIIIEIKSNCGHLKQVILCSVNYLGSSGIHLAF